MIAPVGEHSEKPELSLEMIEAYYPPEDRTEPTRTGSARLGRLGQRGRAHGDGGGGGHGAGGQHRKRGGMTKALPFTEASLARAIRGVERAGLHALGVRPDGTLIVGDKPVNLATLFPAEDQDGQGYPHQYISTGATQKRAFRNPSESSKPKRLSHFCARAMVRPTGVICSAAETALQ
jgi:hypothetical protein